MPHRAAFTMRRLVSYLLRRVAFGVAVVFVVAVCDYGMYRALRPELYPGEWLIGGTAAELGRVARLNLGEACSYWGARTSTTSSCAASRGTSTCWPAGCSWASWAASRRPSGAPAARVRARP